MSKLQRSIAQITPTALMFLCAFASAAMAEPWTRQCQGPAGTEAERCSLQQIVSVDGRVVMTASFGSAEPGTVPRGVITVPLNTKLASGLAIRVDERPQTILNFAFCLRQGCRANIEVTEPFLKSLKSGNSLHVTWIGIDGKTTQLRFDLNGFTTAWDTVFNSR